jgi:hypothetical protein
MLSGTDKPYSVVASVRHHRVGWWCHWGALVDRRRDEELPHKADYYSFVLHFFTIYLVRFTLTKYSRKNPHNHLPRYQDKKNYIHF